MANDNGSQGLDQWTAEVTSHLPSLSKPQAIVLALWSFGMVMTKACVTSRRSRPFWPACWGSTRTASGSGYANGIRRPKTSRVRIAKSWT